MMKIKVNENLIMKIKSKQQETVLEKQTMLCSFNIVFFFFFFKLYFLLFIYLFIYLFIELLQN